MKNIVNWIPLNNKIILKLSANIKSVTLQYYLSLIRKLEQNNLDIYAGKWDSNIKYRKSYGKELVKLDSSFYKHRDVWNDFLILIFFFFRRSFRFKFTF